MELDKIKPIFESPQYVFPQSFGLEDDAFNKKQAKSILRGKHTPIESIGDYTLYELPRGYALIHDATGVIGYMMKFQLDFHKYINRQCVSQILVWRDNTITYTKDLAAHIFFDYLLPTYKTIITDAHQTDDGKRFWDKRIAEALSENMLVFYVNFMPTREITQIHDVAEFKKLSNDKEIWGDVQKHQARRIIITNTPIQ